MDLLWRGVIVEGREFVVDMDEPIMTDQVAGRSVRWGPYRVTFTDHGSISGGQTTVQDLLFVEVPAMVGEDPVHRLGDFGGAFTRERSLNGESKTMKLAAVAPRSPGE